MIGTIRKHSKWLWIVIAAATIVSFIWWGASVPSRGGGGGIAAGDYGTIYGEKVTAEEYADSRNDYYIYYWLQNGFQWPSSSDPAMDQQIYVRILLLRKAEKLGIYADEKGAEAVANNLLGSADLTRYFRLKNQAVPIDAFVKQILEPARLTAADFERFTRDDLILQQLVQTLGYDGQLFTTQQAQAAWRRDHQELQTEAVFFSYSNYLSLSRAFSTPAVLGNFYTNYMADYRLPDRVQVSYVEFNLTNYLAGAEKKIGETNLDYRVNALFTQDGMDAVPTAKTPEEAKKMIRQYLIRTEAISDAQKAANDFATIVFGMTPQTPGNLAVAARQQGLTVETPAPFSKQYGPSEFVAPDTFINAAFDLTPDDPFAGPVEGTYSFYVVALDKQLPTEIPPFAEIESQVSRDYQKQFAVRIAQSSGSNFVASLKANVKAGQNFATEAVSLGYTPEILPPFSLSTQDMPELKDRASLSQIMEAAFPTPVGSSSDFEPTDDGGFVIYVQKQLPVDETAMKSDLPQYVAKLRSKRAFEIFEDWVNVEASRELRSIPALLKPAAPGAK